MQWLILEWGNLFRKRKLVRSERIWRRSNHNSRILSITGFFYQSARFSCCLPSMRTVITVTVMTTIMMPSFVDESESWSWSKMDVLDWGWQMFLDDHWFLGFVSLELDLGVFWVGLVGLNMDWVWKNKIKYV